jgi:hypothetical protein
MQNEPEQFKSTTMWFMVSAALLFDVTQWALVFMFMDWLVTIFAYLTFWLWFTLEKVRLLTPKRSIIQGGTLILEIIPMLAALPAITSMVVLTIADHKAKQIINKTPGGAVVATTIKPVSRG